MTRTLLRIDASARTEGSTTRQIADRVAERLAPETVVTRDLSQGLPMIDSDWIAANFTEAADRTEAQRAKLALSDELIAELQAADTILIAVPIYNFGVPSALKAWIDMIARARVTFRYTEAGPEGLLTGKRAILAVASGGTEVDSAIDFATPYLRHVLGFVGITDVQVVRSDRQMVDAEASFARAATDIEELAA
ncbi:FMN-dependent NADH-azoreductase [Pseudoponticoccus marisrubri]|uniref:FMN dependent NADH:quinone oxidoreductase n=1 Tax=Pseudoponticoccus marisrubri TaxID=1685382 RepID=A0A0W7WG47_9RHOB|nr:NAD(P)H-dependent oxidoreductase [Pseudoponticoccus marisrubri]KUF09448.1 FMN-dependent NADH-azoreductase [Pseudoponticoccus marisrubri]